MTFHFKIPQGQTAEHPLDKLPNFLHRLQQHSKYNLFDFLYYIIKFMRTASFVEDWGGFMSISLTSHNVSLTDRGRDLCCSCGDVFRCRRQILCALGAGVRRRCAQLQEIIPDRQCCAVDVICGRSHTRHIITAPSTPLVVAGCERPVTNVDAWWPSARTSSRGLCNEEITN